jgi:hypothetical protein
MSSPWELSQLEDFERKLRMLVYSLKLGYEVRVRGTPISLILDSVDQNLELLSELFHYGKWAGLNNSSLNFLEIIRVEGEEPPEGALYDPVSKEYYYYASDSLGNPLQVEIEFDSQFDSLGQKDRNSLSELFISIKEIISQVRLSRFDWHFMRQLSRYNSRIQNLSRQIPGKAPKCKIIKPQIEKYVDDRVTEKRNKRLILYLMKFMEKPAATKFVEAGGKDKVIDLIFESVNLKTEISELKLTIRNKQRLLSKLMIEDTRLDKEIRDLVEEDEESSSVDNEDLFFQSP